MRLNFDPKNRDLKNKFFVVLFLRHAEHKDNVLLPNEPGACERNGGRLHEWSRATGLPLPTRVIGSPSPRVKATISAFLDGVGSAIPDYLEFPGLGDAAMSRRPMIKDDMEYLKTQAAARGCTTEEIFIGDLKFSENLFIFADEAVGALLVALEDFAPTVEPGGIITVLVGSHHGRIENLIAYMMHPDAASATPDSVVAKTRRYFPKGVAKRSLTMAILAQDIESGEFDMVEFHELGELEDFKSSLRTTQPASPTALAELHERLQELDGPTSAQIPPEHQQWAPKVADPSVDKDAALVADWFIEEKSQPRRVQSSVEIDPAYLAEAQKSQGSTNER